MPTGFGFADSGRNVGKFVVDAVRYPTYTGWCMQCRAEGTFVRKDRAPTAVQRVPRKINRKLAKCR